MLCIFISSFEMVGGFYCHFFILLDVRQLKFNSKPILQNKYKVCLCGCALVPSYVNGVDIVPRGRRIK